MIFQRRNPLDYERWAADPGMKEWDFAHCLPYFEKMENCLAGGDDFRGCQGPLKLERCPASTPLFQAFFQAVQQAGFELTNDVNGFCQEGFAAFDKNVFRGRRLSAARAYLHPVMNRSNLKVICRAHALYIRFDGNRAVGVDFSYKGQKVSVQGGEIISCGGAFNYPQLLQLSGIGNPNDLEPLGVKIVHELPGVGENLQDHLEVYVQHAPNRFRCSQHFVGGINLGSVFNGFSFERALRPPIILKQEVLREVIIRSLTQT